MPYHVYRRPGSENYWIDIKIKGRKRIRRSSGSTHKATAEAIAQRIEAHEWQRLVHGDSATLTFAEAVLTYVVDGHSDRFLKPLVAHFKDTKVKDIAPGDIKAAARVIYPDAKPATWNRQVITPAKAVINHAASKRLANYIKVEAYKALRPVTQFPDTDWLPRFMDAAPPHLAALALLLRVTGSRIGQALAITWGAVNLQAGTVIIPSAKGFPDRTAILTPQAVSMLANLSGPRTGAVFPFERRNVYRLWKRVCTEAGLPYIPTHTVGRKGFATSMQRAGVDPKTAAKRGGWASVKLMLDIYAEADMTPGLINDVFGTIESQSKPEKANKPKKTG